jgi:tight adherence protein B
MTALLAAVSVVTSLAMWPSPRRRRLRGVGENHPTLRASHGLAFIAIVQLAALLLGVPLLAGACVLAGAVIVAMLRRRADRQLLARRRDVSVDVVFALAAELRAGQTPAQALTSAAETSGVLRGPLTAAAQAVRGGTPAVEPLRAVSELSGCEVLAAVGAVWQVTEQAGGAVADVLDRLGATLDADATDRRALEAALAGPRASMTLLAGLPALGLLMGQSAGAHPMHLLLHRPVGWALLAGAALLELAGLVWSRRLVRSVLPR